MFKQFLTVFFRNLFFCQLQEKKRLKRPCCIITENCARIYHETCLGGITVDERTDNIKQIVEKNRCKKYKYLVRQRYLDIICLAGLGGLPAYQHNYDHYQQEKPVPALYYHLDKREKSYAFYKLLHCYCPFTDIFMTIIIAHFPVICNLVTEILRKTLNMHRTAVTRGRQIQ